MDHDVAGGDDPSACRERPDGLAAAKVDGVAGVGGGVDVEVGVDGGGGCDLPALTPKLSTELCTQLG